ncbi:MAG TPA: hypothetical protein PLV45_09515, partial [bacterium]|nr:hypothetical protein [bacterium]
MKVRIVLLSTLFSGIVLILTSIAGYHYIYRNGIQTIDTDMRQFAQREMQPQHPEDHWHTIETSIRPVFGKSPGPAIVQVRRHSGQIITRSAEWPEDLDPGTITIPKPPKPLEPWKPPESGKAGRNPAGIGFRPPG